MNNNSYMASDGKVYNVEPMNLPPPEEVSELIQKQKHSIRIEKSESYDFRDSLRHVIYL